MSEHASAAPTTTSEEDRHSFGQRRINLIWEVTQAIIAVIVTLSTLYVAAQLALREAAETAAFLLLSNAFFLVIGFYFSRSNHNRINDTAPKGTIDTR
jgi:divalent metal cation (Fe/Co/Zn/Cd) transporter